MTSAAPSESGAPRILLLSNMYPSDRDPRFGIFVKRFEDELAAQGARILRVVNPDPRTGAVRLLAKYGAMLLGCLRCAVTGGYDAVHAHFLFPTGPLALLAALPRRKPVVLFSHGTDLLMLGRRWPIGALTRLALDRAAVVIVPSATHASHLARLWPNTDRVTVLPGGVDRSLFHPEAEDPESSDPPVPGRPARLLFVGALDDNKGRGCEDLLRALESPELADARLVVVGDGPRKASLLAMARRLGDRVSFRPPEDPQRIAELLRETDLLAVLPAERESLGLIALEARATHTPVVATAVGGLVEHVLPGRNGELCAPGDVEDLRRAIIEALARSEAGEYDYEHPPAPDTREAGAMLMRVTRNVMMPGGR